MRRKLVVGVLLWRAVGMSSLSTVSEHVAASKPFSSALRFALIGLLALAWPVGLGACVAWLIGAAISRVSSMGALAAASASTFLMVAFGAGNALALGVFLTLLIFWRHRANIKRIKDGTEPKIGQKG